MTQKFTQFFKRPFPYFQKKWQMVVLVGACVFPILCVFSILLFVLNIIERPILHHFVFFPGAYTLIATACAWIVAYLFPLLFKPFFDAKRMTRGRYFVIAFTLVAMIGLANTLYWYGFIRLNFYYTANPSFDYFYNNVIIAVMVGIIPTAIGYFWLRNKDLHSDLQEKEDQNRKLMLRTRDQSIADEKLITLSGNTKDSVTLFPGELLYMEAVGNYVQIYFMQNGQISQKALRATLSQMEDALSEYPFLVRCHRAFIVNTCQIVQIQDLRIWLKSIETEIPVSKTYKSNMQKQLTSTGRLSQT